MKTLINQEAKARKTIKIKSSKRKIFQTNRYLILRATDKKQYILSYRNKSIKKKQEKKNKKKQLK